MTDFNYKKYSLQNLENWLHDAISSGDASPQEIYDTIVKVVRENYEYHTIQASHVSELLTLLNVNGNQSSECSESWNDFWESSHQQYLNTQKEDKVNRWVLPVDVDGLTGDCLINLPDDLLQRVGLEEGDMIHWIDRGDGSFEMRKVCA